MCPLYTKTFGGKIWKHLHSVSPDNVLDKHVKEVPLWIFPAKINQHTIWTQTDEKSLSRPFAKKTKDF